MPSSPTTPNAEQPSGNSSPLSWGQWAKQSLQSNNPLRVLAVANIGRGIDVLDRNQRRAERIADTVLPSKTDRESEQGDGMGVHFGDVQQPQPIVIAGQSGGGSDLLKGLAIAALGAAIPGAGLAGYALSTLLADKPTPPATQPAEPSQSDFSVGLGKLEDYLENNAK